MALDDQILHAEVGIGLDSTQVREGMDRVVAEFRAKTAEIERMEASAKVGLDSKQLDNDLLALQARLKRLEEGRYNLPFGADTSKADKRIELVKQELKRLTATKYELQIDINQQQRALDIANKTAQLDRSREDAARKFTADSQRVRDQELRDVVSLATLKKRFAEQDLKLQEKIKSAGEKHDTTVNVDIKAALAQLAYLKHQIEDLGGTVDVKIDVDKSALSQAKAAAGGGGSGGNAFTNLLKAGPDLLPGRGVIPAGAAIGLLPAILPLAGAVTSLIGALGSGLAGAAAVAGGTLGGLIANFGGLLGSVSQVKGEYEGLDKATVKYEEAVKKQGAGSLAAVKAQAELNNVLKETDPLVVKAQKVLTEAGENWTRHTAGIKHNLADILVEFGKLDKALVPGLAKNSTETSGIVSERFSGFAKFLEQPQETKRFDSLGRSANEFLKPALVGIEGVIRGLLHIGETAARIFAGPAGKAIKDFGQDFEKAAAPGAHLNHTIETLGHDAVDVFHLLTAVGSLLFTIFSSSASAGDKLVASMAKGVTGWNEWLKSAKGQEGMAKFFRESDEAVSKLAPTLFAIAKLLALWGVALIPFVNALVDIAKWITVASEKVGKFLGITKPLEQIGVALGVAFAVGKISAFSGYVTSIVKNIKELGALGSIGSLFKGEFFKTGGFATAGANAAAEMRAGIISGGAAAAAELRAALVEGGAGGGLPPIGGGARKAESALPKLEKGAVDLAKVGGAGAAGAGTADLAAGAGAAAVPIALPLIAAALAAGGIALGVKALITPANKEEKELGRLRGEHPEAGGPGSVRQHGYQAPNSFVKREEERIKALGAQEQGTAVGSKLADSVLKGTRNPEVESIIRVTRAQLKELSPLGQQAMLSMVTKMVETLEHEGRVVPGTVHKLVSEVHRTLKGLPTGAETAGVDFTNGLLRGIKSHLIQSSLAKTSDEISKSWGHNFGLIPIATTDSFNKVISSGTTDMEKLKAIMRSGTTQQREEAEKQYKALQTQLGAYVHNTRSGVEDEIKALTKSMKTLGPQGPEEVAHAFTRWRETVESEVKLGVKSTKTGMHEIVEISEKETKALDSLFGVNVSFVNPPSGKQNRGGEHEEKKAQGGLVQFGKSGDRGTDKIPAQLMVGSGEVGAVFTGQQQAVANEYLAPVGGLPGLFSSYNKPHYLAAGGFTPSQAYPGRRGRIDQGVDYAGPGPVRAIADGKVRSTGLWHGWPGTGGIVYDTAKGPVYVMEDFVPYVHAGQKLTAGQLIGYDSGGGSGIETGWADSAGAGPLVRYGNLPDGTPTAGGISFAKLLGGALGAVGAAVAHAAVKLIKTPKAAGAGVFHNLAQGVLTQATKSANDHLQAAAARVNSSEPGAYGKVAGPIVTASEFGGHNDASAFGNPTASGKIANDSLWGFAELSHPGTYDFSALGHLPMGARIKVGYGGKVITVPKVDVGRGGAGLGGHPRAIDLTYAAARALGAPGLENVKWSRAMQGGLYTRPALLVGEHENEYVINPRRSDNAEHLKAAGEEMGYKVTPAKAGKHGKKPVTKNIGPSSHEVKELKELKSPAEKRGIPVGVITPLLQNIEKALHDERAEYHSVQGSRDKAVVALKKSKDKGAKAIAKAHEVGDENVKNAQGNAHRQAQAAAEAEARAATRIQQASQYKTLPGVANKPLENAQHDLAHAKAARARAEAAEKQSTHSATHKRDRSIRDVTSAASKANKEAEAKVKDLELGMKRIKDGGVWPTTHTRYTAIHKLEAEQKTGRATKGKLEAAEAHIKNLNKEIGDDAHAMTIWSGQYNRLKGTKTKSGEIVFTPAETATRSALEKKWLGMLQDRKGKEGELTKLLHESQDSGKAFLKVHPSPELKTFIEGVTPEIQASEDLQAEAESAQEATVSGQGPAEAAQEAEPPSAEGFIEKLGGKPYLEAMERDFALAAEKVVPDNPNTPPNEELPGLKGEVPSAEQLKGFWEDALAKGQSLGEPASTIKDLAQAATSARGTYYSLIQEIENAEKNQTSTQLAENQAFSVGRLELYKNFGSNFQPVSPAVPATPAVAHATAPAHSTASSKTVEVAVTNHFSHPPPEPHAWSNGVAWELGAAL